NKRKVIQLNGKEYERFSDHIGYVPLVMITPTDTMVIYQGSEERRKLINFLISQYDRNYLHKIIEYNKILESRNKLLKQFREQRTYDKATLETFDIQLFKRGCEIYSLRKNFLSEFLPTFKKYYYHFGPTTEEVSIAYQSQHHQENILELLYENHNIDIASGFTTIGIHKDDLDFMINDRSLRRYGSQGQQKSFILAMKLAYYEYTLQKTSIKPLLLLDDIFDKLDSQRVEKIVQLVSAENFGQIFITDANKIRIENILEKIKSSYKIFSVNLGQIQLVSEKKTLDQL
ncbi:MAG TPA: DNA replication and repair protein RecF, partial [Salinivirgaceae bacterium]|nr:DNA replication and repair protein RecF [Salinivirgaceae bacterium]